MNTRTPRKLEPAVTKRVDTPIMVGLYGPSGGGKTFSALRLAKGMSEINGSPIGFLDTENRASHYLSYFNFELRPFTPPFGSLDYLEMITAMVDAGYRNIIVDSFSHEHNEFLAYHDREAELMASRMQGNDPIWKKLERAKMGAWIKPKADRDAMVRGLLRLSANFIFCYRSKEKLRLEPGKSPVQLGWMPVAAEEIMYEMTTAALLLPGAKGVPSWFPTGEGERQMAKTAEQFAPIYNLDGPLDERVGRMLATWAAGGDIDDAPKKTAAPRMTAEEWANEQMRIVPALETEEAFYAWLDLNGPAMAKLKAKDESTWTVLNDAVKAQRAKLIGDDE